MQADGVARSELLPTKDNPRVSRTHPLLDGRLQRRLRFHVFCSEICCANSVCFVVFCIVDSSICRPSLSLIPCGLPRLGIWRSIECFLSLGISPIQILAILRTILTVFCRFGLAVYDAYRLCHAGLIQSNSVNVWI